jgi:predicted site-specific integrase-resolvase
MNKRVCIYCRTAQNDQASLDFQVKQLTNFAKQKGLEITKIVSEFGSGLNLNRDGLIKIMKVAKSKQADMILTRDVSRISRDTLYSLKFIENIHKYIEFKTVDAFDIPQDEWDNMLSVLSKFCNTYK